MITWTPLESDTQLDQLKQESATQPVMIFKHSTSCSISAMALSRLERNWNEQLGVKPYFLDLLAHRALSNQVAHTFGISHESPQMLLIRNGACVYDTSHMGISVSALQKAL